MKRIGGLLGRNPFGPLYEHLCKVSDCVELLGGMMAAFVSGESEKASKLAGEVHESEGSADVVKNEIKRNLPVSFFRSAARTEILIALGEQDDIADACRDVATLISMRTTSFPGKVPAHVTEMTGAVLAAVEVLRKFSRRLSAKRGSPFSRREIAALNDLVDLLHQKEFEVFQAKERGLKALFEHEGDIDPVSLIVGMELLERLHAVPKASENAGDRLRRLVDLKH